MLRAISLLLLVASSAYAQKYCCYPKQWEGDAGFLSGSADDEGHGAITKGNAMISMDSDKQAVYTDERIEVSGQHKEYKLLQLFASKEQFIIMDNKCTRTTIGEWSNNNHCVPDNATMTRHYYFGNQKQLGVTEYSINFAQTTTELGVSDDCVPVIEKQYGNIQGTNVFTVSGFFNLTVGIKDPSIFNIPSICNGVALTRNIPEIVYRRRRSVLSYFHLMM